MIAASGTCLSQLVHCRLCGGGNGHLAITFFTQQLTEEKGDDFFVFHHQDLTGHAPSFAYGNEQRRPFERRCRATRARRVSRPGIARATEIPCRRAPCSSCAILRCSFSCGVKPCCFEVFGVGVCSSEAIVETRRTTVAFSPGPFGTR